MAIQSRILVWRIPRTEEPGRLQSMGSQSQTPLDDRTFHFSFLSSKPHGVLSLSHLTTLNLLSPTTLIHLLLEGSPTAGIPTCYNKSIPALIYLHARFSICAPTRSITYVILLSFNQP